MNILIVKYLPGREFSNTAILLNHAKELINKNHDIEELDLETSPPPFFDHSVLMSYYKRNYHGKQLSPEENAKIAEMDKLVKQLSKANIVILASPMHNFGMPGIVKLWFDAVMQKGIAFDYNENRPYGKFTQKKALTIFTSGGEYSCKQVTTIYPEWDTFSFLTIIEFTFMGFNDIELVTSSTSNPHSKEKNMFTAKNRIAEIIKNWKL